MCHKFTIRQVGSVNGKLSFRELFIPCGSWDCAECGPAKARFMGIKARKGFEGREVRFATLTASGHGNRVDQMKSLKASWNRLRTNLTRGGHSLKYCWVLECGHIGGRPHLHILLDRFIPQRYLSYMAAKAGFGRIVDIRITKGAGAFRYVTKYLSKGIGSITGKLDLKQSHGRRISFSRRFIEKEVKEKNFFSYRIEAPLYAAKQKDFNAALFKLRATPQVTVATRSTRATVVFNEVQTDVSEARTMAEAFKTGFLHPDDLFENSEWGAPVHNESQYAEIPCAS